MDDQASQEGSAFYGNGGVFMESSSWEFEGAWPEEVQQIRVRVISYEQGGNGSPGYFEHRAPGGTFISTPLEPAAGFIYEIARSDTYAGAAEFGFINSGWDAETYASDGYEMVVEVWVDGPEPPPPSTGCEEIGQVTRNYVSAHQRNRVHYGEVYGNERRCLVTNFNGAIPKSRSIVRATWDSDDTMTCAMAAAEVHEREVQVTIRAQSAGRARIRVNAELDNGEVYSAWHVIRVLPAPYFGDENWQNGPRRLVAEA